ncbi:ATP-binding protein, partial [candidate division WOR-3 bacterium]|nr:ATP-binding protein [candidate division WOR-3 bacterium]
NVTKQSGIEIDFSVDVDYKRINDDAAINLYRIVQEAINNVIKHSEAKKVEVELKSLKNGIELNVCDDGNGFDTGKSVQEAKMRMGIRGMREMAESLGGTFNIKSTPEQGTEIVVTLPNIEKQKT